MLKLDYLDSFYQDEYRSYGERDFLSDRKLQLIKLRNGVALPFLPDTPYSFCGKGGVINENGEYVVESATMAENLMVGKYAVDEAKVQKSDKRVIWGGYCINAWGHFLVDNLPRFWWVVDNQLEYDAIVFTSPKTLSHLHENIIQIMELLGINREKLVILKEPTCFEEIIVPEFSMVRPDYYTREFPLLLEYMNAQASDRINSIRINYDINKVYLTRTHLKKARQSEIGEKSLETLFRKNGYTILAPEELSFWEQLLIFSKSEEIVCVSGTIPHNMMFSSPKTKWTIINRNVRINTIQFLINQASGCNVTYIDGYIQLFPVSPADGPFWLYVSNNVEKYCNDNGLVVPKRKKESLITVLKNTRNARKYCMYYLKYQDPSYDIGGEILASSRPLSENKKQYRIYFEHRKELGKIFCEFSLLQDLKQYFKSFTKRIISK